MTPRCCSLLLLLLLPPLADGHMRVQKLNGFLERAMGEGLVTDGTVAQDTTQFRALWQIRESFAEAGSKCVPPSVCTTHTHTHSARTIVTDPSWWHAAGPGSTTSTTCRSPSTRCMTWPRRCESDSATRRKPSRMATLATVRARPYRSNSQSFLAPPDADCQRR
jgi:hypothetical protein